MALASGAGAVGLPGSDKFSVSGKGGPFVKQVATRKLTPPADAAKGQGGGLGLSGDAVNRGEFQAARLRMPQTEARIEALLDRAQANWPYDKTQPIKVYVLGLDFYSAYALPDGSLMVAFGLLDQAKSDDEIAFVLSHELGHVRLGHFTKDDALAKRAQMISRLGQAYTVVSALHSGATPTAEAAGQQADATGDLIHFINNVMVEPAWSRTQEDEADALGFDLAQAADFSAEAASARVFDTIQADAVNRKSLTDNLDTQLEEAAELSLAQRGGQRPGRGRRRDPRQPAAGRRPRGPGRRRQHGGRAQAPRAGSAQGRHRQLFGRRLSAGPAAARRAGDLAQQRAPQPAKYADAQVVVPAVRQAMKLRAAGDYGGAATQPGPGVDHRLPRPRPWC